MNKFLESVSLVKISNQSMKGSTCDEIIFWTLFYDHVALFIMASLPYLLVLTVLTFNKSFEEIEVSQLRGSEEK